LAVLAVWKVHWWDDEGFDTASMSGTTSKERILGDPRASDRDRLELKMTAVEIA